MTGRPAAGPHFTLTTQESPVPSTNARTTRRITAVAALALATVLATAPPASAHVEVEAEGARALDQKVTLAFNAESESDKAGITKLEVILPKGLAPADITYKSGPQGWKLAPTDRGYTVSGPPVPTGKDAAYAVVVRQLPDAKALAFKTLQTYDDGRIDRWIEIEEPGEHDHSDDTGHGSPAPMLELAAAAPGAEPVSPDSSTPESPATDSPSTDPAPADKDDKDDNKKQADAQQQDDDSSPVVPLAIGAVVLVAVGVGIWLFRRRSTE
ncbi:DUF1775 domain-containing protein [Streptomyces sp. YC537]|uniref:DUF1775 domain-containing protein n=2 Tax=Streptomyces boluensis TaxID=1775135 RepID=A0A964UQP4_9ACTN|nr:DUF1775 domain-containing protein [Streptomyces boluensis]